jgi:hypothetical protein
MTHFGHFNFHLNLIFGRFDNIVWFFDRKISYGFTLLICDLDLSEYAIANRTKYPYFITALYEIIVALPNKITIYGIEQKVVKDHKWIERNTTVFEYEDTEMNM